MEVCSAPLQQLRARFSFGIHCPTVFAERFTPLGLPTVLRFAPFRVRSFQCLLLDFEWIAKQHKPQKVGHLSVPASRISPERECASCEAGAMRGVALLRVSATIDKMRMLPWRLTTSEMPQMRDLGSKDKRIRLTTCGVADMHPWVCGFECGCQFETLSTPSTSLGRPKLMTRPVFSFLSRRYVRHWAA